MADYRKYAAIVAVFAAVLYLAALIAALGVVSLYTNTDVIQEPDAGPLIGPFMTAAAAIVTLVFLLVIGTNVPPERLRVSPGAAFGVGFAAYFVFTITGGVLYAAADGKPLHFISFIGSRLLSPYAIAAGILAFVITLLYQLVLVGRFRERGRPRWPWERDRE